jgi:hypothetical protein
MKTMTLRQLLLTSSAAFALAVAGTAFAEQPATPFVSGDEPMNVGDSAQIKAPDPSAKVQAKTQKMLKDEAGMLGGDMNPVDGGDAAQIKAPDPSAKAQAKTQKMLKDEAGMLGGNMNPIDEGDAAQMKALKLDAKAQ